MKKAMNQEYNCLNCKKVRAVDGKYKCMDKRKENPMNDSYACEYYSMIREVKKNGVARK